MLTSLNYLNIISKNDHSKNDQINKKNDEYKNLIELKTKMRTIKT